MDTRLILDEPARGSWNMAVDETLLQWARREGGSALRFYQWDEPTLSLGYFQTYEARAEHSPSSNLPVVRRTTGGGAIVHDRELTYSFVTPILSRFSAEAQDYVKQFHATLTEILAALGINANFCGAAAGQSASEPFLCFQRRQPLDILVGAAKVVGSAQRRQQGALLQHGSILLGRSPHAADLTGLAELSGKTISRRELVENWSQRLGKQFGLHLMPSRLFEAECKVAIDIERARFANVQWTRKR